MSTYAYRQAAGIRQALLDRRELALIDVREEADFATAHPLFAVNLPLSKLELEVRRALAPLVAEGREGGHHISQDPRMLR